MALIPWTSPIRHVGNHPQGLAEGGYAGFYMNRLIYRVINLFVLLLIFLTNRLPAIANGGQNGIHCRRRGPKQ